jgi:cellobiose-specific phosphotransferase system component IIC
MEPSERTGSVAKQARAVLPLLALLYAAIAIVLAVVFAAASALDQAITDTLRDPIVVLRGRFGTGVVSNLGVLLWLSAAAATTFAGAVLLRSGRAAGRPLLAAGVLTGILAFDDLFLWHEALDQKAGIPDPATYAVYGLAAVVIAYVYRDYWRRTEIILPLVAFVGFVISIVSDLAYPGTSYTFAVVEDCAKFAGVATWAVYLVRTAYFEVVAQLRA